MRPTLLPIAFLASVLLLAGTPILGAPVFVSAGNKALYAVSFSASWGSGSTNCFVPQSNPSISGPCLPSGQEVDGNGTVGWNATRVTQSTAVLNDTVRIDTDHFSRCQEVCMMMEGTPLAPFSFLESVNLTSRQVALLSPVSQNANLESLLGQYGNMVSMDGWNSSVLQQGQFDHPIDTMWWVNTPLSIGDNVTVLEFSTRINGTLTLDLGSLGMRQAWTLSAEQSRLGPLIPCAVNYCPTVIDSSSYSVFFAYDQTTGLLLASEMDFHIVNVTPEYSIGSSIATPIVNTFALHVSLKMVSQAADPISFGCCIVLNPNGNSLTSNGNPVPPRTLTGNDSLSHPETLLSTMTTPKSLATVSVAIAVVGLIGLAIMRRARRPSEQPGSSSG